MEQTNSHSGNESQAFATQCIESGLLVCQMRADGSVLPARWLSPRPVSWASSPRLAAMIGETFASGGDGSSRSIELYPGCWIACALESTGNGPLFWTMLALTEAGLAGPAFEQICASARLPAEKAAEALRPFIKYTPAQKDQAVATFVRFHQHLASSANDGEMISQFTTRLSQAYEELNLFFRLARSLNANGNPVETVQAICRELQEILPFSWVAASFVGGSGKVPELDGRILSAAHFRACPRHWRRPWLLPARGTRIRHG